MSVGMNCNSQCLCILMCPERGASMGQLQAGSEAHGRGGPGWFAAGVCSEGGTNSRSAGQEEKYPLRNKETACKKKRDNITIQDGQATTPSIPSGHMAIQEQESRRRKRGGGRRGMGWVHYSAALLLNSVIYTTGVMLAGGRVAAGALRAPDQPRRTRGH